MSFVVFRWSMPGDIEWHTLKFVPVHEVLALQAVSTSARDRIRRAFVSRAWDVVLSYNSIEVAYRAVEALCNANAHIRAVSVKFNDEGYGEHMLLCEAVKAHNDKVVKVLLSLEGFDVNAKDGRGYTVLHQVAKSDDSRDIEIVKVLLAHPNVDVNTKSEYGDTPLHLAVYEYVHACTRELMEMFPLHTDVNDIARVNVGEKQFVALAAHKGRREIVQLLLDHKDVDINLPTNSGETILHRVSCCSKSVDLSGIVRMLATHRGLDVHSPIYDQGPVIVWAGGSRVPLLVKLLLEREDIDVNVADARGRTALGSCLVSGCAPSHFEWPEPLEPRLSQTREVLKLLLSHENIDMRVRDRYGRTYADVAKAMGLSKLYKKLLFEATGSTRQQKASKRCVIL